MGTIHGVTLAHEDDCEEEFIGLVEGVKHFVARYRDGTRSVHAAFYFDVTDIRPFSVDVRWIGSNIPAAFLARDIPHSTAAGFLGSANGVHSEALDAAAGGGISG